MDTKVHILDWFMSEFYENEGIVNYMQDIGVVKS